MRKRKRFLLIFIILLVCQNLSQTVIAAETTEEKINKLERKYGIDIKMDEAEFQENGSYKVIRSNVGGIPNEWVAALEDELRFIPAALSDYVSKNVKPKLTIRFLSMKSSDGYFAIDRTAQYTSGNNMITLMFGVGGLAHEYGHMLDYYFFQKNGDFLSKLKSYNQGADYGNDFNSLTEQQKKAFTGYYAASSIHEDIAETFDMLAHNTGARNVRKADDGLSKKLNLVETTIENLVGKRGLFPDSHPQTPSAWAAESSERFTQLIYSDNYGLYQTDITRRAFCSFALSVSKQAASSKFGKALVLSEDINSDKFRIFNTATEGYGSDMELPSYFDDTYDYNVRMAHLLRIVSGNGDGTFNPEGKITRQEAAVMLTNLCSLFGVDTKVAAHSDFTDIEFSADWARDSIDFVNSAGIMTGTGGNTFSALSPYTYEQAYISLLNAYDYILQNE